MYPSFVASGLSGLLLFIALILFMINIKQINENPYKLILVLCALGIGFGIHGISHNFLEIYYNFNPFENKWKCKLNKKC